jgi:hypothetical protein
MKTPSHHHLLLEPRQLGWVSGLRNRTWKVEVAEVLTGVSECLELQMDRLAELALSERSQQQQLVVAEIMMVAGWWTVVGYAQS